MPLALSYLLTGIRGTVVDEAGPLGEPLLSGERRCRRVKACRWQAIT